MIALWSYVALADPGALRGPPSPVVVEVGTPDASVAVALGERVALAGGLRADLGAVEVAAGVDGRLTGEPGRVGLWAGGSAGVVVPLVTPTVGLAATPWLGWVGDGRAVAGRIALAAPLVVAPTGVRAPLLLEGGLTIGAGPLWIGARGGLGARFTLGSAPATLGQIGLVVAVRDASGA
jgi:hypothetical protein